MKKEEIITLLTRFEAAANAADHFPDVRKMVESGSSAHKRRLSIIFLTSGR
jgi:hypothetical protein